MIEWNPDLGGSHGNNCLALLSPVASRAACTTLHASYCCWKFSAGAKTTSYHARDGHRPSSVRRPSRSENFLASSSRPLAGRWGQNFFLKKFFGPLVPTRGRWGQKFFSLKSFLASSSRPAAVEAKSKLRTHVRYLKTCFCAVLNVRNVQRVPAASVLEWNRNGNCHRKFAQT